MTTIQERIDHTREVVALALARAAVRNSERAMSEAAAAGDDDAQRAAREKLRHARTRLARVEAERST